MLYLKFKYKVGLKIQFGVLVLSGVGSMEKTCDAMPLTALWRLIDVVTE